MKIFDSIFRMISSKVVGLRFFTGPCVFFSLGSGSRIPVRNLIPVSFLSLDPIQYIDNLFIDLFGCIFEQFYNDVVFTWCLVVSHLPNFSFHFFDFFIFLLSLFAPVMNFLMRLMFSLLKYFMKCCSVYLLDLLLL